MLTSGRKSFLVQHRVGGRGGETRRLALGMFGVVTVEEARKIFDALADKGKVTMPMQETFWVEVFGMLTDRFGTAWMLNGGKSKM